MARSRLFAAALHRSVELGTQIRHKAFHRHGVVGEFARFRIERGLDIGHLLATRRNSWSSARLVEPLPADQHPPDLTGARADLVELGVTQIPSGGIIVDVA